MLLLTAAIAYAVFAGIAFLLADRMMFFPPSSSYGDGDLPVTFAEGPDGRIALLHLVNPDARLTILYSHGNAEDIGHLAPLLDDIRKHGFNVLAYDYPGYGLSDGGPPGVENVTRAAEAVYRHAVVKLGISASAIVPLGRSVGSGPSVYLAANHPVGGLIIESGFSSAFRVVTRVTLLPFDRFPNERLLREVRVPVLVIHGTDDEVISFSHGPRLAAVVPGTDTLWVEGAGHNNLMEVAGENYWTALREFAARVAKD
jgi:abhydrolase domain-containing protein 17